LGFFSKKRKFSMDAILMAYHANQCLEPNTPMYLDRDGDLAVPTEEGAVPPKNFIYIGETNPEKFIPSNFTVFKCQEGKWRVSGYGNEFDDKDDAVSFAMNTCGVHIEDIDAFVEHLKETIGDFKVIM